MTSAGSGYLLAAKAGSFSRQSTHCPGQATLGPFRQPRGYGSVRWRSAAREASSGRNDPCEGEFT